MFFKQLVISSFFVSGLATAGEIVTITDVQHAWAEANYQTEADSQGEAFESIIKQTRLLVNNNPKQSEYKVWLAILLSSDAGANGGISALSKVKESRQLLEQVESVEPTILKGSVYTSLGSLYYKVPGWPISYGNDKKAKQYLEKALEINPQGIDPNYFYGDYLIENSKLNEALVYLNKAKGAPARTQRPLADQGRQKEIEMAIKKVKALLAEEG